MEDFDRTLESQASIDLHNDLEGLLLSQRLADVKVAVVTKEMHQNCDNTAVVEIPDPLSPVACSCANCEPTTQSRLEFLAHKAILAGEFILVILLIDSGSLGIGRHRLFSESISCKLG